MFVKSIERSTKENGVRTMYGEGENSDSCSHQVDMEVSWRWGGWKGRDTERASQNGVLSFRRSTEIKDPCIQIRGNDAQHRNARITFVGWYFVLRVKTRPFVFQPSSAGGERGSVREWFRCVRGGRVRGSSPGTP